MWWWCDTPEHLHALADSEHRASQAQALLMAMLSIGGRAAIHFKLRIGCRCHSAALIRDHEERTVTSLSSRLAFYRCHQR